MSTEKLFHEFSPISTAAWESIIEKDLKGADYQKKLIWKNSEGIDVRPYYRSEDLAALSYLKTNSGEYPFLRGNKVMNNDWFTAQTLEVNDLEEANREALEIVEKGVSSIVFRIPKQVVLSGNFLIELLANLPLEEMEIHFEAEGKAAEIVESLVESNLKLNGSVEYSPLSLYLQRGKLCKDWNQVWNIGRDLVVASKVLTNFRTIRVKGEVFHESGSGIVQELAFSLACGVEYLQAFSDRGLKVEHIAEKMKFSFSVGSNYFMEIAKFRAARYLWSKVLEAWNVKTEPTSAMYIYAISSRWNKTAYDPFVNMLRTTTEAMSAILGGVDTLNIEAYNAVYQPGDAFGNRIARNQQHLLREESYFNQVIDPAAGSYYIENLTHQLIQSAWKLFLEVQESGGFLAAVKTGTIQRSIRVTSNRRDQQIAERREILLGTNQYPNFKEVLDYESIEAVTKTAEVDPDAEIEVLQPYRGAMAFEALRLSCDRYAQQHHRPKAFLVRMGNVAMRGARAQFAANFFACAGIEPVDSNGYATVEEALAAFLASKAEIVVLCSSDDEYATLATALYEQMKGKGLLVIAGAPACMDELKAIGIQHFIHMKVNVLDELKRYLKELNII
jgi:methylmalonyl-CoA mutase